MGKTWADLKNETLQLMFSYSNNGAILTVGNEDYIKAMPAAANYALRDLAAVCRPVVRKYSISHNPVKNMLGDTAAQFRVAQSIGADIVFTAEAPKAFYFEVDNPCTVLLQQVVGGLELTIQSYEKSAKSCFTAYRDVISLPGTIQLKFLGGNLYNIRNVEFYSAPFADPADVPPFTRSDRYNLKALIGPAFYRVLPGGMTVTGDGAYRKNDEYQWEEDNTLVVDHYANCQFDILYEAYPTKITENTPGTFEPELPPEALDIVPLYMAGRLYMDDNAALATGWLNQYNARRAELSADKRPIGREEWVSESGWW